MRIDRFEEIKAWQKAKSVVSRLYNELRCGHDFSFRDQILRAAISVMNNIAEGFERRTNNELKNFLFIAKGSCGELRSMLYIAEERKYLPHKSFEETYAECEIISKMLSAFIKTL
jgi:four helix bundle protein